MNDVQALQCLALASIACEPTSQCGRTVPKAPTNEEATHQRCPTDRWVYDRMGIALSSNAWTDRYLHGDASCDAGLGLVGDGSSEADLRLDVG